MSIVDPLTKVEAGLKGTGDKSIPLQSVHIRARLLDLAAQVGQIAEENLIKLIDTDCKLVMISND